jgi:hypothetical protein
MGIGFKPLDHEPTVAVKFVSAGTAACIADVFTYPLDLAKVRLQVKSNICFVKLSTLSNSLLESGFWGNLQVALYCHSISVLCTRKLKIKLY